MIEIINKPLLLYLVDYLYYWQMGFNSVFKGLRHFQVQCKNQFCGIYLCLLCLLLNLHCSESIYTTYLKLNQISCPPPHPSTDVAPFSRTDCSNLLTALLWLRRIARCSVKQAGVEIHHHSQIMLN